MQNSKKLFSKPYQSKDNVSQKPKPESLAVIDVEDDPVTPVGSVQQDASESQPVLNNDDVMAADSEPAESTVRSPITADRPSGSCKARMRLRNVVPKNFGHYQLEYAHWLHMSGYRAAKRRRYIRKQSEVRRQPIEVACARRRQMEVGLPRRRPVTTRPTKLLRLDNSDRPAIKSAGPAVSRAPVSMLRLPRNVVDVDTVDAAVSGSDDRGVSDGLRTAIQMHFGAMARVKAGAKCRIMARRWTTDDRLEYLVQWDAGIVT